MRWNRLALAHPLKALQLDQGPIELATQMSLVADEVVGSEEDARVRIESLRRGGLPSLVRNPMVERFYEVLVGPYRDEESVRSMQGELEKAGYGSFVRH